MWIFKNLNLALGFSFCYKSKERRWHDMGINKLKEQFEEMILNLKITQQIIDFNIA